MSTTSSLAAEKYVALVTTKKNGTHVSTPVWIAPLPDGALGFTTELASGKVKRIRNFPSVSLQPSNSRGTVKPGSTPVAATASVLTGADVAPVLAAIKQKYGFFVVLIGALDALRKLVKRSNGAERVAIRIELA